MGSLMHKNNSATRPGLILGLASLLLCGAALAQQSQTLYRWVDKDGHVHYGDNAALAPNAKPVNPNMLNGGEDNSSVNDAAAAGKQANCKAKTDDYNRYKSASSITETDALGNSRTYTPEEKDKLLERKRQDLSSSKCDPPAQAPAEPQS